MIEVVKLMEYSTQKLLELSFAAYRVNGSYIKTTQRFSEEKPTIWSNKELITYSAYHYNRYNNGSEFQMWIPEDFVALEIADEDLAAKEAADKHMRRYTMLAMGNLSDFENDVYTAYCSEKMPINRVGLIAYLPEFVNRELKNKAYKLRLKNDFSNSQHFTDDVVIGDCEILKVIRVNHVPFDDSFYLHFGAIDGNLVCFNRSQGFAEGVTYQIRGKVKSRDEERDTGLPITRINYVKLRKTEA